MLRFTTKFKEYVFFNQVPVVEKKCYQMGREGDSDCELG